LDSQNNTNVNIENSEDCSTVAKNTTEKIIDANANSVRKVLVVSYYFPPMGLSGVQRTLKFVKYLPNYDWSPIVLTTGATNYFAFDETLLNDTEKSDLISIYRTEKDPFNFKKSKENKLLQYPSRFKQKLFRMLSQSVFIPDSRIRWKKYAIELGNKIIEENPDIRLIFATAPPFTDFLVAKELSQKHNIPFVVDYRDLWLDNPQYFFPTPYHKRKALSLETSVLKHTSKIFVITRTMKEKILNRYRFLSHSDISIIPHGYDSEDFEPFRNIAPDKNKLVITHCGLFPDDRTPKYFFKALKKFFEQKPQARSKFEARFVGIMRKNHIKMIANYGLNDVVTVKGYLPHQEAVKHLMESDVLWMMLRNNIETPGRFFEYIGAAKTMLICVPDGSMKQIAEESNSAFITKPEDVDGIVRALSSIYDLWSQNYLPIPDSSFVNQYDRKALTKRLAREISFASKE
jgi:glycosyltransferase involved in cell wall biosynthesis